MPQNQGYKKLDLSNPNGPMHKSKKLKRGRRRKGKKNKKSKNKGGVHRKGGY